MALRFEADTVFFENTCTVEEALPLAEHLRASPETQVDLRQCSYLHTSLMQVLVVFQPKYIAFPEDYFMARWLTPFLKANQ